MARDKVTIAPPTKHTLGHKDCPPCERAKSFALRKLSMSALGLVEAGELWLSGKHWKRRKPKTIECNEGYLRNLIRFFGNIPLSEIHAGSLLAYQTERSNTAGASCVNHELNALSQILKQAGLWVHLKDFYSPLSEPEWKPPKVFTYEQQQRIFDFAKDDPDLELAQIVFTITRNTSASGSELRLARIGNLDLNSRPPMFRVTGDTTKNTVRPRLIPLTKDAEQAFRRAMMRAGRMGAFLPTHFLFPFTVNRCTYDPNRPASRSWLRHQTRQLRKVTGIEHIQPHAWRHQLCTEMLEQGVPEETVKGIMGWVSEKMISHYSHTRIAAKMDALKSIERIGPRRADNMPSIKLIKFPRK